MIDKSAVKKILGDLPLTAEVYWQLRQQGKPLSKSFSLRRTQKWLPIWMAQAEAARQTHASSELEQAGTKRILIFATLRYWIEHATLMGLALSGLGHTVTLAYLPYANWRKPMNRFDLRRQNAYARQVLQQAAPLLKSISFFDGRPARESEQGVLAGLPSELAKAIRDVSLRDVQYTLQIEDVDLNGELYRLRLQRNAQAAQFALAWFKGQKAEQRPEVVLTPNGSILEMGAVYQVARYLGIPVVTYEFGEQRDRIWLARNAEVMRQETDEMWLAHQDQPLSEPEWEQVRALFASRQQASLWENFSRRWQGQPSQGGEQVRQALQLDARPVVLLAANVIGDSLTLGRQVFSQSMTEWLQRTVRFFAQRPDVQLVVRVHPGERYTQGPSVADVVQQILTEMPPDCEGRIVLVAADDPVNTYDLVEVADLGLVYTTTVGMEMAMSGVPVIVAGQTHYRSKGFTLDPAAWEDYFKLLGEIQKDPQRFQPSRQQVELAWNYAYRFFFDYPVPFPWHLLHFWNELESCSLEEALSAKGQAQFGETFGYLAGETRRWADCNDVEQIVEHR